MAPGQLLFRQLCRTGTKSTKPLTIVGLAGSSALTYCTLKNYIRVAECRANFRKIYAHLHEPWLLVPIQAQIAANSSLLVKLLTLPVALVTTTYTILRLTFRALYLGLRFVPLFSFYPLTSRVERLDDIWWKVLLWLLQGSGPTVIKLGQWASTRRDIFSKRFCDKLSILHTNTKGPKLFRECDEILKGLFGDYAIKYKKEIFQNIRPYSVGSGCITHIYRMTVDMEALEMFAGYTVEGLRGIQDIVIKVADKGIENQIRTDMKIIRHLAGFAQVVYPPLRFLDPIGSLDQFEMVLRRQVDLRNEGRALQKFAENFEHGKLRVHFPKVVAYNERAIAETFEKGDHFENLLAGHGHTNAHQTEAVRHKVAVMGARGFLKMAFVDNFIHGDLHPGNILIRFNDGEDPEVHHAELIGSRISRYWQEAKALLHWRGEPKLAFTNREGWNDEPTLILLDAGIAMSQTPENRERFRQMFKYIIGNKGYEAGKFFLTYKPEIQQCKDPDAFCKDIEKLVAKARVDSLKHTINVTQTFNDMFMILWKHHVMIDSSFTSVMLSMMVLEGFGRTLDPKLDLFKCAQPFLLDVLF
ncbi:unnamed protein product, partial [Mesorhabditis spiculigera]